MRRDTRADVCVRVSLSWFTLSRIVLMASKVSSDTFQSIVKDNANRQSASVIATTGCRVASVSALCTTAKIPAGDYLLGLPYGNRLRICLFLDQRSKGLRSIRLSTKPFSVGPIWPTSQIWERFDRLALTLTRFAGDRRIGDMCLVICRS